MSKETSYIGRRDPRFVTIRRDGTLEDQQHRLLAAWAADCAEHVLHYFDSQYPDDNRPRRAIEQARAWARGEISMTQAREAAYAAHDAAKEATGTAREAARAAGHAVATAHMADHELGAAAYAIRAVRAASPIDRRDEAGRLECQWQHERLSCVPLPYRPIPPHVRQMIPLPLAPPALQRRALTRIHCRVTPLASLTKIRRTRNW